VAVKGSGSGRKRGFERRGYFGHSANGAALDWPAGRCVSADENGHLRLSLTVTDHQGYCTGKLRMVRELWRDDRGLHWQGLDVYTRVYADRGK
jgi:hypothetical protein